MFLLLKNLMLQRCKSNVTSKRLVNELLIIVIKRARYSGFPCPERHFLRVIYSNSNSVPFRMHAQNFMRPRMASSERVGLFGVTPSSLKRKHCGLQNGHCVLPLR
jgi:hypothetical protein